MRKKREEEMSARADIEETGAKCVRSGPALGIPPLPPFPVSERGASVPRGPRDRRNRRSVDRCFFHSMLLLHVLSPSSPLPPSLPHRLCAPASNLVSPLSHHRRMPLPPIRVIFASSPARFLPPSSPPSSSLVARLALGPRLDLVGSKYTAKGGEAGIEKGGVSLLMVRKRAPRDYR